MAEATCTAAGLITAGACFTGRQWSRQEQLAILAYLMWKWAESASTGTLLSTWDAVISAATCTADGLSQDQLVAAVIGILNRGESGLGSLGFSIEIPVLTADTAATAIACIKNTDEHTLKATIVFNLCRLFGEITD